MRFIPKVVDQYVETRQAYMFDMDTFTVNERSKCGCKYATALKCRGSDYIKVFYLVKKNDFIPQFRLWIKRMREDAIYRNYNWKVVHVIKTDNDGVWSRRTEDWVDICNEFDIRMMYAAKDRYEDTSHAERLMGLLEVHTKAILFEMNLPEEFWVMACMGAVWLLNRLPKTAALAEASVDGDCARPIEKFTLGWYSRSQINRELAYHVQPGTLVLAHDVHTAGSTIDSKVEWKVAKGMLREQLVVFDPWHGAEMKIISYKAIQLPRGWNWMQYLDISYKKPYSARMIPGDAQENMTLEQLPKAQKHRFMKLLPVSDAAVKGSVPVKKMVDIMKHITAKELVEIKAPDLTESEEKRSVRVVRDQLDPQQVDGEEESIPEVGTEATEPSTDDGDQRSRCVATQLDQPIPGDSVLVEDPVIKHKKRKSQRAEDKANKKTKENSDAGGQSIPGAVRINVSNQTPSEDVVGPMEVQETPEKVSEPKEQQREPQGAVSGPSGQNSTASEENNEVSEKLKEKKEKSGKLAEWDDTWSMPMVDLEESGIEVTKEDKLDLKHAMKDSIVVKHNTTFRSLCRTAGVNLEVCEVYREWLVKITQGDIQKEDLGDSKQPKSRVKTGIRVPKPYGRLWMDMVIEKQSALRYAGYGNEALYMAEMHAARTAKAFSMYVRHECKMIEANKTKKKGKENVPGIPPPPKGAAGIYKIIEDERRKKWIAALLKEINALTDMGTITHLHSAAELLEMGLDISKLTPIPSHVVCDNKFPAGVMTWEELIEKVRLVMDGRKQFMQKGKHYEDSYAATPKIETIYFINGVCVAREGVTMYRKAFDVGNAYANAGQEIMLAIKYPHGFPQRDEYGNELYMCLHTNTYGKPDGANLWEDERNTFLLDEEEGFNQPGWTIYQSKIDRCLFWIKNGDQEAWMLVWTDDFDLVGTSQQIVDDITAIVAGKWKIKIVDETFMVGMNRRAYTSQDGERMVELTMTAYVDNLVSMYEQEMAAAGWGTNANPEAPTKPNEWLSMSDEVEEAESKEITQRGYMAVCGGLLWATRIFVETKVNISNLCRVMSKPSKKAWKHAMQCLAWIRDQRTRGILFRENGNNELQVCVDASNKADKKDSRCQYGVYRRWKGGPILTHSSKLPGVGYGAPGNEYMAVRWAAVSINMLREMMKEIGFADMVTRPTPLWSDSKTAVGWVKGGKVTMGNGYLPIAYHQSHEMYRAGVFKILEIEGTLNPSDMFTKPLDGITIAKFLNGVCGYEDFEQLVYVT